MWEITAAAHGILLVAYAAIAYMIGRGQFIERNWLTNPIATGTFAIFLTCAIGHGIHMEHTVLAAGSNDPTQAAARMALADPALVIWTPLTAAAAIWYFTQRKRLRILQSGAPMVEDMEKRRKEATILHEAVLASTRRARTLLQAGDHHGATVLIDEALTGSESIISELLGKKRTVHKLRPGDLRRSRVSR